MSYNKITFVILYDKESVNTINLLNYINENLEHFNNKMLFIDFIKIEPKDIDTEEFINFRKKFNIESIPSVLIHNKKDINVISDAQNIKKFLENIVTQQPPQKSNIQKTPEKNYNINDFEEEDNDIIVEKFMNDEIKNKSGEEEESIFGDASNDLSNKIKFYSNNKVKENIITKENPIEDNKKISYDEKLLNNVNKNNSNIKKNEQYRLKEMLKNNGSEDDKLISSKFLNNLED